MADQEKGTRVGRRDGRDAVRETSGHEMVVQMQVGLTPEYEHACSR
uniref:Uncharacterized protein n=1 Tax=Thermosporothrix sp. COM3 TaxID=2490863 RepID=A0A455SI04_9CHLR|nr:hypothetical protein KTC_28580 [Thermosporothrix sp. COM3]